MHNLLITDKKCDVVMIYIDHKHRGVEGGGLFQRFEMSSLLINGAERCASAFHTPAACCIDIFCSPFQHAFCSTRMVARYIGGCLESGILPIF